LPVARRNDYLLPTSPSLYFIGQSLTYMSQESFFTSKRKLMVLTESILGFRRATVKSPESLFVPRRAPGELPIAKLEPLNRPLTWCNPDFTV